MAIGLLGLSGASAEVSPPELVIETASLLAREVEQSGPELATDLGQQRTLVESIVRPRFHLETSAVYILGRHWRDLTESQREHFMLAFYEYLLAAYGDALQFFNEETIRVHPKQTELISDRYSVDATLTLDGGDTFGLQLKMRCYDREWFIFDIVVDGVSYVRHYRSDFGLIVRQDGFAGLIDWLETTTNDHQRRTTAGKTGR